MIKLTLKEPNKIADKDTLIHLYIFYFYLSKKIRLDVLCESSVKQRIHINSQGLFSLNNDEKIVKIVVCCSRN